MATKKLLAPMAPPVQPTPNFSVKVPPVMIEIRDEDVPTMKKLLDIASAGVPDAYVFMLADKIRKQLPR